PPACSASATRPRRPAAWRRRRPTTSGTAGWRAPWPRSSSTPARSSATSWPAPWADDRPQPFSTGWLMTRLIAILGYHKIGPWPGDWETWYYVPEETFAGHLRALREGGWRFLDASAFLRGLDDPDTLPWRSALVTFDDGYRSLLEHGLPTL